MSRLSPYLRGGHDGYKTFYCPGCAQHHSIRVGEGAGARWGYNGDPNKPTFTPSILVRWSEPSNVPEEFDDRSKDMPKVCHSFITNGSIQFLGDCTHHLAGQTVPLPEMPSAAEAAT